MKKFVVVSTSVDKKDSADHLAESIVRRHLAACVQHTPVHSTYRWKGKLESAQEFILQAKTTADRADELIAFIRKNHTYEVPEIIVTPILKGHRPYLEWVAAEAGSTTDE